VKDTLGEEEVAEVKRLGELGEAGFTFFRCGMA
jgi:hypothetical protein